MIQLQIFKDPDPNVITRQMNDFLRLPGKIPVEVRITENASVGMIIYDDTSLNTPPPNSPKSMINPFGPDPFKKPNNWKPGEGII